MATTRAGLPAQGSNRPRARKSIAHMPSPPKVFDQENVEPELPSRPQTSHDERPNALSKKSRSKSFGPAGLEALKETTGNRRKSAILPTPKSILKPTIPLSPLREIPTRRSQTRHGSEAPSPTKSPNPRSASGSDRRPSPARARAEGEQQTETDARTNGSELDGPNEARNAERAPDRDPDAEERARRKAEIQKQRELRRKSMANRRVSFAPEATLHTWDTEVLQDATASSTSTDATRRAPTFPGTQATTLTNPATPVEQIEDPLVKQSPEPQRKAHQKKRRRSLGVPPMNFNDPEALSSSPYSGSSAVGEDETGIATNDEFDDEATTSASDNGDNTLGDVTMHSVRDGDNDTSATLDCNNEELDASLQDAAKRAGTRELETDENGDVSMELAGDDVTAAFQPWVRQSTGMSSPHPTKALARPSEEKTNPFSPAFRQATGTNGSPTSSSAGSADASMDMTSALGGIVQTRIRNNAQQRRASSNQRQSITRGRRQSEESSELGDGPMEFTTALGGLQKEHDQHQDQSMVDENEELSMEFTSVFGGLKQTGHPQARPQARGHSTVDENVENEVAWSSAQGEGNDDGEQDGDMDMTTSFGGIIPRAAARQDDSEHQKGGATQNALSEQQQTASKQESTHGSVEGKRHTISSTGCRQNRSKSSYVSHKASSPGSPALSSPSHKNGPHYAKPTIASSTPSKVPRTPSHQVTPQFSRPTTPGKTPPSANVSMRKTSPKKLFQQEIRAARSPSKGTSAVFEDTSKSGYQTPKVVLDPRTEPVRRMSGIGIDKSGLGSPRMAAILDRRRSITDDVDPFAPSGIPRGVRFDDPRIMDVEVSRDLEDESKRESARFIIKQEADAVEEEKDVTANLKEMMQSMTPKRNKLKGRKSLAVGAARGLLGKRPAELDGSEDEMSPRTFGQPTSPVKRVRLDNSSSSSNTTERVTHGSQAKLRETSGTSRPKTPTNVTSPGSKRASTPRSQGRFKDVETLASAQEPLPVLGQGDPADVEEKVDNMDGNVSLQDFLNLTNIRFMELTTTKRRATLAPTIRSEADTAGEAEDPQQVFEQTVIAGACTIPMLELYQHSCRELKKYISEGRSVVRSIEAETLQENPSLFKEYLSASPSDRQIMDNQFKNMKTNARLLSKATWYEWRMKLLDGLMESLNETAKSLAEDDECLSRREAALSSHLPSIMAEQENLEREYNELKSRADGAESSDPKHLGAARERLQAVDSEIETKSLEVESHIDLLQDLDAQIAKARATRDEAQQETRTAQMQHEECRGWSMVEIKSLQSRINELTAQSKWSIQGVSGPSLVLSFDKDLQFSFNTRAFLPTADADATSDLSLTHVPADPHREPISTTKRFFIQYLRARLLALPASTTSASHLLQFVASGWNLACSVERQIAHLKLRVSATEERIVGDEHLAVDAEVLLTAVKTKVKVSFELEARVGTKSEKSIVDARADVAAGVVYGEGYRVDRMAEFVKKRIDEQVLESSVGDWAEAVMELRKGLVKRGAK